MWRKRGYHLILRHIKSRIYGPFLANKIYKQLAALRPGWFSQRGAATECRSYNAIRGTSHAAVAVSFLFLAFLNTAAVVIAQDNSGKVVQVVYDPVKDVTQITLNPIILVSRKFEELRLAAAASYLGKVKVQPKEVSLVFISLSPSNVDKYDPARKLTITVDDQVFPIGETQRAKQTQNGLFLETMATVIPMDLFERISQAKDVTMKLGITMVKLSSEQISMLRTAASYMNK